MGRISWVTSPSPGLSIIAVLVGAFVEMAVNEAEVEDGAEDENKSADGLADPLDFDPPAEGTDGDGLSAGTVVISDGVGFSSALAEGSKAPAPEDFGFDESGPGDTRLEESKRRSPLLVLAGCSFGGCTAAACTAVAGISWWTSG